MSTEFIAAKKDFRELYDANALGDWATRYPDNIRWNYENLLLDNMTREDRQAVRGLELRFPLVPPPEHCDMPFAFCALASPPQITLPILSIKFFDDLAMASAFLEVHGFSQETIFDYIALLKYGSPGRCPGGVFPAPLSALQVPNDALENRRVDDLSQKIAKSSLVWVLAHELGHVRLQHGYDRISRQQAQENETEADAFATELFRRAGVLPAGMTLLFMMLAHLAPHRGDYASDSEWQVSQAEATHPVSTERMQAMAATFRKSPSDFVAGEPTPNPEMVLYVAGEIEKIARFSEDPSLQRFIRLRGLAVTPEALAPRASNDPFGPLRVRLDRRRPEMPFDGLFEGTHTRALAAGGEESLDACVLLERGGDRVEGRFNFGMGEGVLKGTAAGDALAYDWEFGDVIGRGELRCDQGGELTGVWGYGDSHDGGGSWRLQAAAMPA